MRFIIVPGGLLRESHDGHTPDTLLGGQYRYIDSTAAGGMYARSSDTSEYRSNIRLFTENLAHVANVEAVVENGRSIPLEERATRFGFLKQESGPLAFTGGAERLDVAFGDRDEDVTHLYIDRVVSDQPITLTIQLRSGSGAVEFETRAELSPGVAQRISEQLSYTAAAAHLTLQWPDLSPACEIERHARAQTVKQLLARVDGISKESPSQWRSWPSTKLLIANYWC